MKKLIMVALAIVMIVSLAACKGSCTKPFWKKTV